MENFIEFPETSEYQVPSNSCSEEKIKNLKPRHGLKKWFKVRCLLHH